MDEDKTDVLNEWVDVEQRLCGILERETPPKVDPYLQIINRVSFVLINEDEEVSAELTKAITRKGIQVMTGSKVTGIEKLKTKVKVTVSGGDGEQVLDADQVLVATGFVPNSAGLGLEEVGVKLSERGAIEIDARMATNVPGIWAIGDVTAKLMLAHVGSAMGIICAELEQTATTAGSVPFCRTSKRPSRTSTAPK